MPDTKYQTIHGWVEDIERDPSVAGGYRLFVKQEEGQPLEFAMGLPGSPLKLGDEVSLAVDRARPAQVLSLVVHSTGEGTRFPHNSGGGGFTGTDWAVIVVVAVSLAVALAWIAVPTLAAFVLVYGLLRRSSQQARRQREAARMDYLLDRDYFRWRAELDRKREMP